MALTGMSRIEAAWAAAGTEDRRCVAWCVEASRMTNVGLFRFLQLGQGFLEAVRLFLRLRDRQRYRVDPLRNRCDLVTEVKRNGALTCRVPRAAELVHCPAVARQLQYIS